MQRIVCKSKLHRATVTQADLHYDGSITIDKSLMAAADLLPYEQVHVVNINNGQRFVTYVIEGESDSGIICINGAAARLACPGDLVIILGYAHLDATELTDFKPNFLRLDENNRIRS